MLRCASLMMRRPASTPRFLRFCGLLACASPSLACGRTALDDFPLPPVFDAGGPPVREASSGVDVAEVCVPGEQVACTCPGGSQGVAVCTTDGGLTACRGCPDLDATAPKDAGIDAACTSGTHDCAGHTPDVCNASGQWVLLSPCSGNTPLCADGACVACSPGTVSCIGNVTQVCDDLGGWQSVTACAQPTPDCSMGSCTCLETACATGCIDTTSDPHNCGGCAHDCLGGGCTDSACQPVVVATTENVPDFVASDGTSVFWTDFSGDVFSTPISGGSTVTLATSTGEPSGLAVTSNDAYWGNFQSLLRIPDQGGATTTLAPLQEGLAIDDTNVYWGAVSTVTDAGMVLSMPLSGGAPATLLTLAMGETASALAADGMNVYAEVPLLSGSGGASLVSVPRQGGASVTLATIAVAPTITAGGGNVYWTVQDPSLFWPLNSLVMSVPMAGGTPVTLANGQSDVGPIVTDGVGVYWANNCETAGSPCSSVLGLSPRQASTVVVGTAQAFVYGMAVDESRVFWTSYGGTTGGSVQWVAK